MYAATGGPNVKWGAPISNGGAGDHWTSAGDGPAYALFAHITPHKAQKSS